MIEHDAVVSTRNSIGEEIKIAAAKTVKFLAGKTFKDAVKKENEQS